MIGALPPLQPRPRTEPDRVARADLAASERFYRTVLAALGAEPVRGDGELVEWRDWDLIQTDREHPVSGGLHVGFQAPDRAAVDAFWRAGIDRPLRAGTGGPRRWDRPRLRRGTSPSATGA